MRLMRLGDEDAAAFNAVSAAYALPKEPEAPRQDAIQAALVGAAKVPLETLRAASQVAALAARAAEAGNRNAVSDAGVGALLAGAAARGAAYNVRINVAGMPRPAEASDAGGGGGAAVEGDRAGDGAGGGAGGVRDHRLTWRAGGGAPPPTPGTAGRPGSGTAP